MDYRGIAGIVVVVFVVIYLVFSLFFNDFIRHKELPGIAYRSKLDYLEYLESEKIYFKKVVAKYEKRRKLSDLQKQYFSFYKEALTDIDKTIEKEEKDLWKL